MRVSSKIFCPQNFLPAKFLPAKFLPAKFLPAKFLSAKALPAKVLNAVLVPGSLASILAKFQIHRKFQLKNLEKNYIIEERHREKDSLFDRCINIERTGGFVMSSLSLIHISEPTRPY